MRCPGSTCRREAIALTEHHSTNDQIPTTPKADGHSPAQGAIEVAPTPIDAEPLQAGAPVRSDSPTFAELGVHADIVRALEEVGIERTFAIQELTLPLALAGEDVIGQARTGTGKTLGFGVPMLHRLRRSTDDHDVPQALVVVPTRELCVQVARDLADAGKHQGARVAAIYGGRAYEPQLAELRKGVDIVVGTPGRLLDLAEQRHLALGRVSMLVLDEADEMLDLGFLPDVERILRMLPEQRQTMLFSATMPGPIITLSRTFLNQPTHIRAEEVDAGAIHERTRQLVYRAHALDKVELLAKSLQAADRGLTMIFTRTKRTAQRVSDDLTDRGFAAAAVHGDLGQGAREQALRAFRSEKVDVLVATDVAARGIDVTGVTHVVNYQCPEDAKTYIHRIGRTGRAGREGVAVTLVDWDEMVRWKTISDELGLGIDEPVETYSTSDHLFSDLGIPTKATSRLPRSQRTRAGLDAEELDDDGGPRGRGGRRPARRGAEPAKQSEQAEHTEHTHRTARPTRQRRRRRGGVIVAGQEPAATNTATAQDESATSKPGSEDVAELAPAGHTGAGDGRRRRPRRRRRGGGSSDAEPDTAAS